MEATTYAAGSILAPYGTFEGSVDQINARFVAGWAWDRQQPDTPVRVEVWDGDTLVATSVADVLRPDLRSAHKGDGRHGFLCPLQIRGRRPHAITVRIAGTPVTLPDARTGDVPRPITRHDRPPPQLLPPRSLRPYANWFYFGMLKRMLRMLPQPAWRLPAAVLASVRIMGDRESWRLSAALLTLLRLPPSRWARLRLHWMRCYLDESNLLLAAQSTRMTRQWAAQQMRCDDALPPGGAVLIAPHHALCHLGALYLASVVPHVGGITDIPREPDNVPFANATMRAMWQAAHAMEVAALGRHHFHSSEAGRSGLRLLQSGGYLMLLADGPLGHGGEPCRPMLGRAVRLPRGAAWFAQRSGKPIVPWMVVPDARGWRLWLGDPVPPTQEGVIAGLEACIRQSPASWERAIVSQWLAADEWRDEGNRATADEGAGSANNGDRMLDA